jgi:hypothetical protein
VIVRRAAGDEVADQHQTGRNADPHFQRLPGLILELWHRFRQRQAGAHRAFSIVLTSLSYSRRFVIFYAAT